MSKCSLTLKTHFQSQMNPAHNRVIRSTNRTLTVQTHLRRNVKEMGAQRKDVDDWNTRPEDITTHPGIIPLVANRHLQATTSPIIWAALQQHQTKWCYQSATVQSTFTFIWRADCTYLPYQPFLSNLSNLLKGAFICLKNECSLKRLLLQTPIPATMSSCGSWVTPPAQQAMLKWNSDQHVLMWVVKTALVRGTGKPWYNKVMYNNVCFAYLPER